MKGNVMFPIIFSINDEIHNIIFVLPILLHGLCYAALLLCRNGAEI